MQPLFVHTIHLYIKKTVQFPRRHAKVNCRFLASMCSCKHDTHIPLSISWVVLSSCQFFYSSYRNDVLQKKDRSTIPPKSDRKECCSFHMLFLPYMVNNACMVNTQFRFWFSYSTFTWCVENRHRNKLFNLWLCMFVFAFSNCKNFFIFSFNLLINCPSLLCYIFPQKWVESLGCGLSVGAAYPWVNTVLVHYHSL